MANVDALHADFARSDPDAFARIISRGDVDEINAILERLSTTGAATVVSKLPGALIETLLDRDENSVKAWLSNAPIDTAIVLLSHIPREISLPLVNALSDRGRRRRFLQYLQYPAHSVGALVKDVPLKFRSDMPAREALEELQEFAGEDPGPVVVISANASYVGLLDIWKLLTSPAVAGTVNDYMLVTPPLYAETPVASAIADPNWQEFNWLPIIDHERRILGGVSRASLYGAKERSANRQESGSLIALLLSELPYVTAQLVSSAWGRRKPS